MPTAASPSAGIKLFTTIYNDARLLGHFLEHYSREGITEFYIATNPDFRPAIERLREDYNVTVVETADVADHFIGGAAAVTQMRRRFQASSEWGVLVDLDEFVEFAGDLPAIIHQAEREGANVVRAVMWDRFGREGKVVGFDPGGDLRQVFPIRARFIKNVMLGADYKGVLVKGLIESDVAHHTFVGEVVCSRQLDLSHYKWFDGAVDRLRAAHRMVGGPPSRPASPRCGVPTVRRPKCAALTSPHTRFVRRASTAARVRRTQSVCGLGQRLPARS